MRAVFIVFLKEFRENLRERRTLFSALILGPLLAQVLAKLLEEHDEDCAHGATAGLGR